MGIKIETPEVPGIPQDKIEGMGAENKAVLQGHKITINPTNELRYKRNVGRLRRLRNNRARKLEAGVDPNDMRMRRLEMNIKKHRLEIELYKISKQMEQEDRDRFFKSQKDRR